MSRFKKGDIITDNSVIAEIIQVYNNFYTLKLLKTSKEYESSEYDIPCKEIDTEEEVILYIPLSDILKQL